MYKKGGILQSMTSARAAWQAQEAKARFSELLETSLAEGPQLVTKRGVETAVLVPIDQWRRLEQMSQPTLKQLLLAPEPQADIPIPPRRRDMATRGTKSTKRVQW